MQLGVQLHPEISHTERGTDMLKNFAVNICKARADWQMENFTAKEVERIRKLVGPKAQVVCFRPTLTNTSRAPFLLPVTFQSRAYSIVDRQMIDRCCIGRR